MAGFASIFVGRGFGNRFLGMDRASVALKVTTVAGFTGRYPYYATSCSRAFTKYLLCCHNQNKEDHSRNAKQDNRMFLHHPLLLNAIPFNNGNITSSSARKLL
jgi:hypothetical protein